MKTKYKIIIIGIIVTTIVFGGYQYLMYQCGTLPVFMETPRSSSLWNCLEIWKNQLEQQGLDGKYQYQFGETTIKNEKDQQFDRVFFSYSHDYGATFSEPQDISMSEDTWTGETKMILMDNYVILVWREEIHPEHTLSFAKSDDYGKTLEKKYLWFGSRPDIIHYDDVLYLTWTDLETRQVLYTTSDDRGETFGEHKVIFAPKGEFSPYANKPTPKLAIDDSTVKISWRSPESGDGDPQNFEYVIYNFMPSDKTLEDNEIIATVNTNVKFHIWCANQFDESLASWERYVEENYGGPGQPIMEPPSSRSLIMESKFFEEWRNNDCVSFVFDWAYLSENEDYIWKSGIDWESLRLK